MPKSCGMSGTVMTNKTPYGDCQGCGHPMRDSRQKPNVYPFKTTVRCNATICSQCRMKERNAHNPAKEKSVLDDRSAQASLLKWYLDYVSDRVRRGIPAEGILFSGETLCRPQKRSAADGK